MMCTVDLLCTLLSPFSKINITTGFSSSPVLFFPWAWSEGVSLSDDLALFVADDRLLQEP